MEDPESAMSVI